MTRALHAVAAASAVIAISCAPAAKPLPSAGAPHYPDFVYPVPVAGTADARLEARLAAAWSRLQAGDARAAEAEFAAIVGRRPGFYPAAVGWGYALVAAGHARDALARFDQAIRLAPKYAPGLAGRAEALLAAGRRDEAVAGFEAALASDSTLGDLRRRIEVLRFSGVSERIASGREAAGAGRLDEAKGHYEAALAVSPDSAFLHRDLGLVELRRRDLAAAAAHLRRAAELDPTDAEAHLGLADVLLARDEVSDAIGELERAYELNPSDDLARRLDDARARASARRLPPEYAAISQAPQITRGDLAALLGVRVGWLMAAPRARAGAVAIDVRGHWASAWILGMIRAGVMDVLPNHAFQPRALVRRADLAVAVSRVLALAGPTASAPGRARPEITDVGPDHLRYADIEAAVSAGILTLDRGLFRPSRAVSGEEAIEAIRRLERAAPPPDRGR